MRKRGPDHGTQPRGRHFSTNKKKGANLRRRHRAHALELKDAKASGRMGPVVRGRGLDENPEGETEELRTKGLRVYQNTWTAKRELWSPKGTAKVSRRPLKIPRIFEKSGGVD